MDVYTIQMAQWRKAKKLGIGFLDTTVKSGDPVFSPSWEMVRGYKEGLIDERTYEVLYKKRMVHSFTQNPERWRSVIRGEPIALSCYCAPGVFCHRHLLTAMFKSICERREIPFTYHGEIT